MKKDLLTALFLENSQLLYRIAFNKSQNHEFSEDIVQQVFTTATEKLSILKTHPNPTAWLVQTEKFILRNEMRKLSRLQATINKQALHTEVNQDPVPDIDDSLQEIQQILSADDYQLLVAVYIQGQSYRELAAITGRSEASLRKRCERAKKKISKFLL